MLRVPVKDVMEAVVVEFLVDNKRIWGIIRFV
jgi:hypothetical protein